MAQAKTPKTLDEETFNWIESAKQGKVPGHKPSTKTNAERQRSLYIRRVALKEIADLTRLAECLPEDQQQQIFNDKMLRPFLKALLNIPEDYGLSREKDELIYTSDAYSRRQRLIAICYDIITTLNDPRLASALAPIVHDATVHEGSKFAHLHALYHESLIGVKKITIQKTA